MHDCLTPLHNHTPTLFQIGLIDLSHPTILIELSPVTNENLDMLRLHQRSLILIAQVTLRAHTVSTMLLWQTIPKRLSWIQLLLSPSVRIAMPAMTTTLLNAHIRVSLWNVPVNLCYLTLTKIAPGLELNLTNFSSDFDYTLLSTWSIRG